MRVLVTGIGGFVGRHLATSLRRRPEVILMGADRGSNLAVSSLCDIFLHCDIRDRESVSDVVARSQPDWVFHLAGVFAAETDELIRVNTLGSVALFDAVLAHHSQAKVLLVGSAAEYGATPEERLPLLESHVCQPTKPYGVSKFAATRLALFYARTRGLRVVVARPFNVIGPGVSDQLVVGAVIARIREAVRAGTRQIKIGNMLARRDFLDVRDLVDAYGQLLEGDFAGEVFNLCSGRAVAIGEIVERLVKLSGTEITLEVDRNLLQPLDIDSAYGSYAKARAAIGFEPTTALDESLRAAWEAASREGNA